MIKYTRFIRKKAQEGNGLIHIKELFRLQDIQHLRLIAGRDGLSAP